MDQRRIAFVYFDAGSGHRATMEALCEVLQRQNRNWIIQRVDFQEVLQPHDPVKILTGMPFAEAYTKWVGTGWTMGATQGLKLLHGVIRLYHRTLVATLASYWRTQPVDMVVSIIPNFNRVIAASVRAAMPGVPFVTIISDIADYPPHFWIEQESEFIVCGSERAVQQATKLGHDSDHVFKTSGMVLHPRFHEPLEIDREAERRKLGLSPDLPTALVLFGGGGSSAMVEIAERLEHSRQPLQLIFICGRNEALADKLRRRKSRNPFFVEGFTREVPYYMRLSDVFIGKPGPGSVSEALACGLPVIVESNLNTLPQERYNAEWVKKARLGVVVSNFGDINSALTLVLSDPVYRHNARDAKNTAVFEIPGILEQILRTSAEGMREHLASAVS